MYFQNFSKKITCLYCLVHHGATIPKFSPVSTKLYVRRTKLKFPTICTEIWDLTKIDPFEAIKKQQLIILLFVLSMNILESRRELRDRAQNTYAVRKILKLIFLHKKVLYRAVAKHQETLKQIWLCRSFSLWYNRNENI